MMNSLLTGSTELKMSVNGMHTFTILNSPDTGLLWMTRSDMNKDDYVIGLSALIEASYNISMQKIRVDSKRIKNSIKTLDEG